jgi:DNA-binding Lrp family transcriptional regulator
MISLLSKYKYIAIYLLIVSALVLAIYSYYLDNRLEETKTELKEANANNEKIIEAYEYTLKVEKEIAKEQTVTSEQKEKIVVKYQTLIKEVEKRGEIKQDEKSNFTIVSF